MKESIIIWLVKIFGTIMRCLPLSVALWIGRRVGVLWYWFDLKRRTMAYSNLRMAFVGKKSNREILAILKRVFQNYGQNIIEFLRLPLMSEDLLPKIVSLEGGEIIKEAMQKHKGVIFLAIHSGNWELASLQGAKLGFPYKVVINPQMRFSKLYHFLNSYREGQGIHYLFAGPQTKEIIKSLRSNEIVSLVVDQGGKRGTVVDFFGRGASMSTGAIRLGTRLGAAVCFANIHREKGAQHRIIISKPLEFVKTDNAEQDVVCNLNKAMELMEQFVGQYPDEYMWFYKIWKYSKEAAVTILYDGRTGHLRQSQAAARMLEKALAERNIKLQVQVVEVVFKSKNAARLFSLVSALVQPFFYQGRLEFLQKFFTPESYRALTTIKTDYFISCGSTVAGINRVLSKDYGAKSVAIQKPGLLSSAQFDLVILPEHDLRSHPKKTGMTVTNGAPNLINDAYLKEQAELLLNRFSHLKNNFRDKIGLFIGGDAKDVYLSKRQMQVLIQQIKEVAKTINADILITTSRRTPAHIESLFQKEFKNDARCPLLILANKEDVPEAVGGILGLSNFVVTSGDSISMISETASSGNQTIVFSPQIRQGQSVKKNKHMAFIAKLNQKGFILSTDATHIGQAIYDVAKNKIQMRRMDDDQIIFEAMRKII